MVKKGKLFGFLIAIFSLCVLGFVTTFTVPKIANADTITINGNNITVYELSESNDQVDGKYNGIYCAKINFGTILNSSGWQWTIMWAANTTAGKGINDSVQDYILVNGKTVRQINSEWSGVFYGTAKTREDQFTYYFNVFWNHAISLRTNVNSSFIECFIYSEILDSFSGALNITVKGGFSYTDSASGKTFSYTGSDINYRFLASQWYKDSAVPVSYNEVSVNSFNFNTANAYKRYFIGLNQAISSSIEQFHITQHPKVWNQLQNFIFINGKSVTSINATVDDSAYNYASPNWVLSWASTDYKATYCQPIFLQTSGSSLVINIHNSFFSTFGKYVVVEMMPGFGWYDGSGNVYMNTEREILAHFIDTLDRNATMIATQADGIDVGTGCIKLNDAGDEYYFDIGLSANIMTDVHYNTPVNFDYAGDIWGDYVYIDGTSIKNLTDKVRVAVASGATFSDKRKVRFYIDDSLNLDGKSIVFKNKMPFSSGEILSQEYTLNFITTESAMTDGENIVPTGELVGECVRTAYSETDALKAVTVSMSMGLELKEDITVRFTYNDNIDCDLEVSINGNSIDAESDGKYYYKNVLPQSLSELIEVSVSATDINGNDFILYSNDAVSVKSYFAGLLGSSAAQLGYTEEQATKMKQLIVDLLYYAETAQEYAKVNTENIMTDIKGDIDAREYVDPSSVRAVSGNTGDYKWHSAFLNCTNNIKLVLTVSAASTAPDYIKLTLGGNNITISDYEDLGEQGGRHLYRYYYGISLVNFDTTITAVIVAGSVEQSATLTYSVASYIVAAVAKQQTDADLLKSIYNYGKSAYEFAASL